MGDEHIKLCFEFFKCEPGKIMEAMKMLKETKEVWEKAAGCEIMGMYHVICGGAFELLIVAKFESGAEGRYKGLMAAMQNPEMQKMSGQFASMFHSVEMPMCHNILEDVHCEKPAADSKILIKRMKFGGFPPHTIVPFKELHKKAGAKYAQQFGIKPMGSFYAVFGESMELINVAEIPKDIPLDSALKNMKTVFQDQEIRADQENVFKHVYCVSTKAYAAF